MSTFNRIALLAVCGAICGGCVGTVVDVQPDPLRVRVTRLALFYRADVPEIGANGIKGYSGRGDAETIKAAVEAAVKAAIAGAGAK